MRWSIVRLIWLRELRDQLRDRRTVFMIAVPAPGAVPVGGFRRRPPGAQFLGQQKVVGVAGLDNLLRGDPDRPRSPSPRPGHAGLHSASPGCPAAWPLVSLARSPWTSLRRKNRALAWRSPFSPSRRRRPVAPRSGSSALPSSPPWRLGQPSRDYPPLVEKHDGRYLFVTRYREPAPVAPLSSEPIGGVSTRPPIPLPCWRASTVTPLDNRTVDVILVVPPGFQQTLAATGRGDLYLLARDRDETSRLVNLRVNGVLDRWKQDLKRVRLTRQGLPTDFRPASAHSRPGPTRTCRLPGRRGIVSRPDPHLSLHPGHVVAGRGALPRRRLCAGEKERGTMETLLISPAGREEIVCGKFLTIWVFSAATALLNLLSMAVTTRVAIRCGHARHRLLSLGAVLERGAGVAAVGLFSARSAWRWGPTPGRPRRGSIT